MKKSKKIAKRLETRQKSFETDMKPVSGYTFHRPGSQNLAKK